MYSRNRCIKRHSDKTVENPALRHLEKLISGIEVVTIKKAVPMTVTTRAVGIVSTIFYDLAISRWGHAAILEIATIHQVYRVCLWLFHYKMLLARRIQTELGSTEYFQHIYIDAAKCGILDSVLEVPILMAVILDAAGKIETTRCYHLGYGKEPTAAEQLAEYRILTITPDNIRSTLGMLENSLTSIAFRKEYQLYNCIPGAQFVNNILMNADQIYPQNYGLDQLEADVNAYKCLLRKFQSRALLKMTWNGKASKSGLCSGLRSKIRIQSSFKHEAQDQYQVVNIPAQPLPIYLSAEITTEGRTNYWSVEEMSQKLWMAGIGSLVGENCSFPIRDEGMGSWAVSASAVTVLYNLSDAEMSS